jgi:hypothetical protein
MSLNRSTGLDPEGIKVRPVDSFSGAAEFNEFYWLWNKVIKPVVVFSYTI